LTPFQGLAGGLNVGVAGGKMASAAVVIALSGWPKPIAIALNVEVPTVLPTMTPLSLSLKALPPVGQAG
jgi:hypothetical protein